MSSNSSDVLGTALKLLVVFAAYFVVTFPLILLCLNYPVFGVFWILGFFLTKQKIRDASPLAWPFEITFLLLSQRKQHG